MPRTSPAAPDQMVVVEAESLGRVLCTLGEVTWYRARGAGLLWYRWIGPRLVCGLHVHGWQ